MTGNPIFGAVGSVVIGVLLIVIATMLATEIKSLIIGESADDEFKTALLGFLEREFPQLELLDTMPKPRRRYCAGDQGAL
ncbi:MAG: hypothetical protein U1F27_02265 [Turneriella sp.]